MKKFAAALLSLLAIAVPSASATVLESQAWWQEGGVLGQVDGTSMSSRHIHLSVDFPLHQNISGIVSFPVTVKLHNQPGTVKALRVQVFDVKTVSKSENWTCATDDCTFTDTLVVDTRSLPDGNREFRFTANIPDSSDPGVDRFYETTRWHAVLSNGNPVNNGGENRTRSPGAGGWYQGVNYMNVFCGYGNASGYNLIVAPNANARMVTCRFDRSWAFVSIDPDFHHGYPGRIIVDKAVSDQQVTFTIPTDLTPGQHKLFVRTDAQGPTGVGSGALVMFFTSL